MPALITNLLWQAFFLVEKECNMLSMFWRLVALNPQRATAGISLALVLLWASIERQGRLSCQAENTRLTQQVALWEANAKVQAAAMEVDRAYLQSRADLDRRADAARRVRPSACLPVAPSATSQLNAAARDARLPLPDAGVDRGDLLDFARDCEAEALKLDAWQRLGAGR